MTDSERRDFYLAVYNEEVQKQREKERKREAKEAEASNRLYYRLAKAEDEISHFYALANSLTAQRDSLQAQLDEIRAKIFCVTYELDPEEIAHGDKRSWAKTADMEQYMEMYAKNIGTTKDDRKRATVKMEKEAAVLENKIFRLGNQIFSAQQRAKKAECEKQIAEQKLSA